MMVDITSFSTLVLSEAPWQNKQTVTVSFARRVHLDCIRLAVSWSITRANSAATAVFPHPASP
eukprot:3132146-Rhodomonas_salina.2